MLTFVLHCSYYIYCKYNVNFYSEKGKIKKNTSYGWLANGCQWKKRKKEKEYSALIFIIRGIIFIIRESTPEVIPNED